MPISTKLKSISTRPSCRNTSSPSHGRHRALDEMRGRLGDALRKSAARVATTTRIPVPATLIAASTTPRRPPRSAKRRPRRRGAPSLRVPRLRPTPSKRGASHCPPRAWQSPVPDRTRQRPARAPPMTLPQACLGVRGCATSTTASAISRTLGDFAYPLPRPEALAHHSRLLFVAPAPTRPTLRRNVRPLGARALPTSSATLCRILHRLTPS